MLFHETFDPEVPFFDVAERSATVGCDLRDGSVYVYEPDVDEDPTVLAVRVALATGRPLLLFGPPGSGKSSLAAFVARTMKWNYFEQVISSRTSAQDLKWSFDAVRRLRDAQADQLSDDPRAYVEPGVLWWAFDPKGARRRGFEDELPDNVREAQPMGELVGWDHPNTVLLDEIDKADPDVPNDLLVALGSQEFKVTDSGTPVKAVHTPLVIITSNNERSLPKAFLRRCIIHELLPPSKSKLVRIAQCHFRKAAQGEDDELFEAIAQKVVNMQPKNDENREGPSTAEYLDAVRACLHSKVGPGESPEWRAIESAVLIKRGWLR